MPRPKPEKRKRYWLGGVPLTKMQQEKLKFILKMNGKQKAETIVNYIEEDYIRWKTLVVNQLKKQDKVDNE